MELSGTALPVVTALTMELFAPLGTVVPVDVELHYDPTDPFAVTAVFDAAGEETVILELRSPDGESALQTRAVEVASFLEATSRVVPFGTESSYVDIDALVAGILASAGA
jgi:hypothetical protein